MANWGRHTGGQWEGPEWAGFQAYGRHPPGTPRLSLGVDEILPGGARNKQESRIVATVTSFMHTGGVLGCLGFFLRARYQCSNCRAVLSQGGALRRFAQGSYLSSASRLGHVCGSQPLLPNL